MTITIRIVAVAERPVEGKPARFTDEGGTIGRRSDSTLVIPDQSRRVSRIHAVVSRQGNLFKIRDQGSFLPVYVNGHGVGFQREMTLRPGDRIQIGPYTLEVAADAAFDATLAPMHAPSAEAAPKASAEAPMTLAQVPFEVLEKRLAAAKASGPRLTTDSYPIPPDATATQDKPFEGANAQHAGAPVIPIPAVEEAAIDLEPVGSRIVRNLPDFPPPFAPGSGSRASSAVDDSGESPRTEPAPSKPARVISLLETARRVLGGRS